MLTRRRLLVVCVGSAAVLGVLPGIASAGPPVACQQTDPSTGVCLVWAAAPGSGTSGVGEPNGHSGASTPDPNVCTAKLADPQPSITNPVWAGLSPRDGAIYVSDCPMPPGFGPGRWIGLVFRANGASPPGAPPVDPRALAQQAIASMVMRAPQIELAPPSGSTSGLVGLPVWMWVDRGENLTGPTGASASAGGVTVTAVGEVTQVVWDMGDGHSVTCGMGTPYSVGASGASPDCGYTYAEASTTHVPGTGAWPVTATSTWMITWTGGGQSGTKTVTLSSSASLRIGELNVLNEDGGNR